MSFQMTFEELNNMNNAIKYFFEIKSAMELLKEKKRAMCKISFRYACIQGNLNTVRWMVDIYTREEFTKNTNFAYSNCCLSPTSIFKEICETGNAEMAKWFYETFLDVLELNKSTVTTVLKNAIERGLDTELYKFLISSLNKNKTKTEILRNVLDEHTLCEIACCKKENTAKAIALLELLNADTDYKIIPALKLKHIATLNANIEVFKWFFHNKPNVSKEILPILESAVYNKNKEITDFILTAHPNAFMSKGVMWVPDHEKQKLYVLLQLAVVSGDLAVVKNIIDVAKFNPSNKQYSQLFEQALLNGNNNVVLYLYPKSTIQQTYGNASTYETGIFEEICGKGHLENVKWICLRVINVRCIIKGYFNALKNCKLSVAKWLYENFSMSHLGTTSSAHGTTLITESELTNIYESITHKIAQNLKNQDYTITEKEELTQFITWAVSVIPDVIVCDRIFELACVNGFLEIAQLLSGIEPRYHVDIARIVEYKNNTFKYELYHSIEKPLYKCVKTVVVNEVDQCAICMSENCELRPKCGHAYCKSCVTTMIKQSTNKTKFKCPYCRKESPISFVRLVCGNRNVSQ